MNNMKRKKKGEYGYIHSERKKRILITIVMFLIPLVIYFTGLYLNHTRKNILTLVAIMGCLPASKVAVDMILIFLQKPITAQLYDTLCSHIKDMTAIFETTVTTYDKNFRLACIVVSGLNIVGYSEDPKIDVKTAEAHIKKIVQGNGYRANVKIFTDLKPYLRRLDEICENHLEAEAQVPFKPDENYPDATRNEIVKAILLAISV